MKVTGRIVRIMTWEKRGNSEFLKNIKKADGEYDFIIIKNIYPKSKTMKEKFFRFMNGPERTVEQAIIGFNERCPVKRPHDFKKGDLVEIDLVLRKITNGS